MGVGKGREVAEKYGDWSMMCVLVCLSKRCQMIKLAIYT